MYLANSYVGDDIGKDFVSIAFVKLWEVGRHPDPKGFLMTTVKNECLNHLKHEKRKNFHHQLIDVDIISDEYADSRVAISDLINFINEKIETLPPAERKVFDLLYMEQLTPNEASQKLNVSVNSIRVLKMRLDKDFKFLGTKIFKRNCWYVNNGVYLLSKKYVK